MEAANNYVVLYITLKGNLTYFRWGQTSADALNCSLTTSISSQIKCLQEVPLEEIVSTSVQVGYKGAQAVVDGAFADYPFLPDHPKLIMSSGGYNNDINVMLGVNR